MTAKTPHDTEQQNCVRFEPYTSLYGLLESVKPECTGLNSKTHRYRCRASREELARLVEDANCTMTAFSGGIRAIGLLMAHSSGVREMPDDGWRDLGELLVTLSEAQLALADLERLARESEPV